MTPEKKDRILRRKEVTERTSLARSTIYDHVERGTFPKPVKLSYSIIGWLESEVDEWIEKLKEARE
jgi:prophage regulatory protein